MFLHAFSGKDEKNMIIAYFCLGLNCLFKKRYHYIKKIWWLYFSLVLSFL